ncbi:MAG TPA: ribosome maturation factor RimP [Actinomycetota bacterium]|nr:ribosome maturation factor RimP [Actinomycetota bacterium]
MGTLEEVRDLAESVARRRSLRIWGVEMSGSGRSSVVRVFVDADGGVDLDTVASVSEEISRGLDLHDPIPGRYTLEVSSPGLERSLKDPEHFRLSVGRKVVVKTTEPLVRTGHRIEGLLADADPEAVAIETEDGRVAVPLGAIKSAKTVFEWK